MLFAMIAVLAAAATDAAPATAPTGTPPAAAAKPAQKSAEEMVCHTEQVTGSMFPHKICRRKADAEADRADQQKDLRGIQHPMTLPTR